MAAVTYNDYVQPRSFCGEFSYSWRGMTSYSASWFGGNICRIFAQCWMRLCKQLWILRTFTAFAHVVYSFCARCADFAYVYYFGLHDVQYGQSWEIQSWRFRWFILYARAARNSPSELLGGLFVVLDRSILPGGVILLYTMLLCGSYII